MVAVATDIDTTFTKKELNIYELDNGTVLPTDLID
jgi:hypothetical protein